MYRQQFYLPGHLSCLNTQQEDAQRCYLTAGKEKSSGPSNFITGSLSFLLFSVRACGPVPLSLQRTNEKISIWLTQVSVRKGTVGVFPFKISSQLGHPSSLHCHKQSVDICWSSPFGVLCFHWSISLKCQKTNTVIYYTHNRLRKAVFFIFTERSAKRT